MDLQVNPLLILWKLWKNMFFILVQRMRSLPDGWTGATMAMHDKYKTRIKLADQDILNILFRFTEISLACYSGSPKYPQYPIRVQQDIINILFRITEKSSIHISCWCSHTFFVTKKSSLSHSVTQSKKRRMNAWMTNLTHATTSKDVCWSVSQSLGFKTRK